MGKTYIHLVSGSQPHQNKIVLAERKLINPPSGIYISVVSTHTCTVAPSTLTPHYIFPERPTFLTGRNSLDLNQSLISTSGIRHVYECVCGVIKAAGEKVSPECVHVHQQRPCEVLQLFTLGSGCFYG